MWKNKDSWESARPELFEAVVSKMAFKKHTLCDKCGLKEITIVCYDCHLGKHLCWLCDVKSHENFPFRDRLALVNGFLKAISPNIGVNSKGDLINIGKSLC